jgi:hypothetical protein
MVNLLVSGELELVAGPVVAAAAALLALGVDDVGVDDDAAADSSNS